MKHSRAPSATALALATLGLLASSLAGCLERDGGGTGLRADSPELATAGTTKGWQPGNWWAYRAAFDNGVTIDVALIVFEARAESVTLGSNLSAGFFGLPFNGNVTIPNLNPVIAGEEWRLYDFPLSHAKEWTYEFMGYTLAARASEADLRAPHVGTHAGFSLVASSFGRTVVQYTYSSEVEWFTELVLYEPTDGHEVVRVTLTDYGERYGEDYYVSVPVAEHHVTFPAIPAEKRFIVEGRFLELTGTATLVGKLGTFRYELRDPHDRIAMRAEVTPTGAHVASEELESAPGAWTLTHLGAGQGSLHFEMSALEPVRDGRLATGDVREPTAPPAREAPPVDLPALLARTAPDDATTAATLLPASLHASLHAGLPAGTTRGGGAWRAIAGA